MIEAIKTNQHEKGLIFELDEGGTTLLQELLMVPHVLASGWS